MHIDCSSKSHSSRRLGTHGLQTCPIMCKFAWKLSVTVHHSQSTGKKSRANRWSIACQLTLGGPDGHMTWAWMQLYLPKWAAMSDPPLYRLARSCFSQIPHKGSHSSGLRCFKKLSSPCFLYCKTSLWLMVPWNSFPQAENWAVWVHRASWKICVHLTNSILL